MKWIAPRSASSKVLHTGTQALGPSRSSSCCSPEGWNPRLLGPRDTHARDLGVDQIGLAVHGAPARALERHAQLGRRMRHLRLDAEALRDPCHVHVRIAEVVVEE